MSSPTVSICISAFNRPKYCINNVLLALAEQTTSPDEVVLVDDGSSIATAKEAFEEYKDHLNIKYIWNNNPGNTANTLGNNVAVRNATSDLLLIISADVVLENSAVKIAKEVLKESPSEKILGYPVLCLTTQGTKKFLSTNLQGFFSRVSKLSIKPQDEPITEASRVGPYDILARYQGPPDEQVNYFACCLHRKTFIEMGGFNEDYSILGGWEDQDFKSRTSLVMKTTWAPNPSFHLGHWYDTPEYFKPKQNPDWGKPELRTSKVIPIWTSPLANVGRDWGVLRK